MQCLATKSRRKKNIRCPHPALPQKSFCGIHKKTHFLWQGPDSPLATADFIVPVMKIWNWWLARRGLYFFAKRGAGYYDRSICVNATDFFTCDDLQEIPVKMFYSYRDPVDKMVYGFDIRSIHTLIEKARLRSEIPNNPYTRKIVPLEVTKAVRQLAYKLKAGGTDPTWEPIQPQSPEQQWRMRVIDTFAMIDDLQYTSNSDWFLSLTHNKMKLFYLELLDIWFHRAGLSSAARNAIVPINDDLFSWSAYRVRDCADQVNLRNICLKIIRRMISSAENRNDKVLGAMYVITALTQVCSQAAETFPWLFESAAPIYQPNDWLLGAFTGLGAPYSQTGL